MEQVIIGCPTGTPESITIFDLAKHLDLFANEEACDRFVAALVDKLRPDTLTILTKEDFPIATVKPATAARDAFQIRIAAKLVECPDLVRELKSRVESDEFIVQGKIDVPD
jgi:hypothetical protein